jgi:hypothetical protein
VIRHSKNLMPKLVFFLYIHPYLKELSCDENVSRIVAPGLGAVVRMSAGTTVMDCCRDVLLTVESRVENQRRDVCSNAVFVC